MSTESPRLFSDAEVQRIFERDILPLMPPPSMDREPRVLIFGGQPGSRKTTLAPLVADQLGMGSALRVDGDDLFSLFPGFEERALENGMAPAVQAYSEDFNALWNTLISHSIEHRVDLMLVGPYAMTEPTTQLVHRFASAGFRVELAYNAMHPALSQLGVMHRHHKAMQPGGIGYSALISVEKQEKFTETIPGLVTEIQRGGSAQALHVVDTSGVSITSERGADGRWHPSGDLGQAFATLRDQPWGQEVKDDFVRRRAIVAAGAGDQWQERLARMDALAAPMLRGGHTDARSAGSGHPTPGLAAAAASYSPGTTGPKASGADLSDTGPGSGRHSGPEHHRKPRR